MTRYLTPEWIIAGAAGCILFGILLGYVFARLRNMVQLHRLSAENTALSRQLQQNEQHKQESLELLRAGFEEQQKATLAQFEAISAKVLENNTNHLRESNRENIDSLLRGLKPQLEALDRAVQVSHDATISGKTSLEAQIQNMLEQTKRLDHEATALTRALKGNTKTQGDWGEMILERMLEMGGLRKNEEYFIQYATEDDLGNSIRPDVIVHLPGERRLVIDSKVSLTHFTNYMASEDESERANLLSAHYKSVQTHIRELAAKNYSRHVKGALEHVLMFIPNESSYIAAMQYARETQKIDLQQWAYEKGVLLISPGNLLLAISITRHVWKKQWQAEHQHDMIKQAQGVYEKCRILLETLNTLGKQIETVRNTYIKAKGQMKDGQGNLIDRAQALIGHSPEQDAPEEQDQA